MSDHPNAARYRQVSAALSAGDVGGFADVIADDIVWWEIGSSESVRGKDAVIEQMQFMSDYDVHVEIHDVVANDDHLIALVAVTATKGDETLEYRTAEVHHVNADGQVTERWAFSDDTQAIIDFFA